MQSDNITRTGAFRDALTKADFEYIHADLSTLYTDVSQAAGKIPFVNGSGVNKPLSLSLDNKVPFQKQNGTQSNFNLTT